jgi:hypothetical protein
MASVDDEKSGSLNRMDSGTIGTLASSGSDDA